jgi:tRNA-2-methylthio-N6-dimethylallyladenosine synthase
VHAEGPSELIGEIVEVDILAAGPNSLHGVINLGFAWREPVQAAV